MATLTIRVDDDLRDRITVAAEQQGVTASDYVREAIEVRQSLEPDDELGRARSESSSPQTLSSFERKVLLMLHRNLLAAKGDLHEYYYDAEGEVRAIKALEGGYVAEYDSEFADTDRLVSRSECELVWDILDMFRIIQGSVRELGKDGWEQLGVKGAKRFGTFGGFDLNDPLECRLHDYAEFLIKGGKWSEQREAFSAANDNGNSHHRMLPQYRSMLRIFKPLWRKASGGVGRWHLSAKDVRSILLAAPGASSAES